MIRKLRLKFVLICMSLVTAILAVVFSSVFFAIRLISPDFQQQRLLGENQVPVAHQQLHHVIFLAAQADGPLSAGGENALLSNFRSPYSKRSAPRSSGWRRVRARMQANSSWGSKGLVR